jgi:hypothetical protein
MARSLSTRGRFALAYLVLGAAVGTGIGTFIVLLQRPSPGPPPAWSSWRPAAASPRSQVLEIANHVGSQYLLPSGGPLAAVRIDGPAVGKDLRAIIVPAKSNPQTLADFDVYEKDKSVIFVLCGLGTDCKISDGTPSTTRGTVLRREALELALYTFEYVDSIDNVLVFVPPAPGEKKLTSTLFFHRGDLSSNLKHPLRRTLTSHPPLPGRIAAGEQETVDSLTGSTIYRYVGILPANGFGKVLVIQPPG